MCVPLEMTRQLFVHADVNGDLRLSPDEFSVSGEGSKVARVIDEFADHYTQGDDEYNPVEVDPAWAISIFDRDRDGSLDEMEVYNMMMYELLYRRGAGHSISQKQKRHISNSLMNKLDDIMWYLDTNRDGTVSAQELERSLRFSEDFGDEMMEAALANEDQEDPNDASNEKVWESTIDGSSSNTPGSKTKPIMMKVGHATMHGKHTVSDGTQKHVRTQRSKIQSESHKARFMGQKAEHKQEEFEKAQSRLDNAQQRLKRLEAEKRHGGINMKSHRGQSRHRTRTRSKRKVLEGVYHQHELRFKKSKLAKLRHRPHHRQHRSHRHHQMQHLRQQRVLCRQHLCSGDEGKFTRLGSELQEFGFLA